MARMIPDTPVEGAKYAEQEVYRRLRDGLPDDYTAFHSLPMLYDTTSRGLREGEIDFVVTHPTRGLLVIEVKGGASIRCSSDRTWTSVRHDTGETFEMKDPYEQARTNLHRLIDACVERGVVANKGAFPFAFGHACWFPGTDRVEGTLPMHVDSRIMLTRRDHDRVQQAVDQAFGVWRGKPEDHGSPGKKKSVLDDVHRLVLQPEFRVKRTLRTQIQEADEEFLRMTEEQAELFNGLLKANRRALVKGYAGTGKTFLAVHRAAELGREGKDTLLLCFNRHLADHLDQEMEGVPNTKVATFHQLADEWAVHAPGQSFPEAPDQEFWESGSADLLLSAVEHAGIRYDAILVDEAQDFREDWWLPVDQMLKDDSHFYVFFDPGQDIYGGDVRRLLDLPTSIPLRKNCRSTKHISRFAEQVANRDEDVSIEHVGEGVEVRRHVFSERSAQVEILEEIVRHLKQERGLSSSDLVLLSPRSYASCLLADVEYRLAGYDVEPYRLTKPGEGTLYYESIHGFKGMEAPAVVLFDVRAGHVSSSNENVYVGSTRARHLLHVLHDNDWSPDA